MQIYQLILGILAVWRLTSLLNSEAGPRESLEWLRRHLARSGFADWLSCFYCSSAWVSIPFALILDDTWKGRLLLWPALSAGAIIVEKTLHRETFEPVYYEDEEEAHVLPQGQNAQFLHDSESQ